MGFPIPEARTQVTFSTVSGFRISPLGSDPVRFLEAYVSAKSGSGSTMTHYIHNHPSDCEDIPEYTTSVCVLTFEGSYSVETIVVEVPLGIYVSDPSVEFRLPLVDSKYRVSSGT